MMNCRGFWGCKKINAVSGIYNCGQTHISEKKSVTIFVGTRYVFENRQYRKKKGEQVNKEVF